MIVDWFGLAAKQARAKGEKVLNKTPTIYYSIQESAMLLRTSEKNVSELIHLKGLKTIEHDGSTLVSSRSIERMNREVEKSDSYRIEAFGV